MLGYRGARARRTGRTGCKCGRRRARCRRQYKEIGSPGIVDWQRCGRHIYSEGGATGGSGYVPEIGL
jgi:hypothetical protein